MSNVLTMEALERAYQEIRMLDERYLWRENRDEAIRQDLAKGRGKLVINPEVLERLEDPDVDGQVIELDGVGYRVVVDKNMRGMKTADGHEVGAFKVAPLPPLRPMVPLGGLNDD